MPTVDDLLAQLDGRSVTTKKGIVVLHTKDAKKVALPMPFKFRFLAYVSDPNVAYILMMLGIYGIIFEFYSPGAIFPGVIGGICLILALYAFQAIPISFAGLALILLGIVFFVLEVKIVSHGALGIAGIISVVIGSLMLVDLPGSALSISVSTIVLVAVIRPVSFSVYFLFASGTIPQGRRPRRPYRGGGFAGEVTAGGKGQVKCTGRSGKRRQ